MYAGLESVTAVLFADGQGGNSELGMPSWLQVLLYATFGGGLAATISVGAFHEVAKQLAQHSRLTRGLSTALFLLGAAAVVVGGIATLVLGLNPAVFSASAVFGSYAMWMGHRLSRLSFDLTDGHTAKLLAQESLREKTIANDRAEFQLEQEQQDADLTRRERAARIMAEEIRYRREALELDQRLRELPEPPTDPDDDNRSSE
ncbi:hypothetical protein [Mycobacteroides abscessus]|uniref:hypothetical protein n=1 Tax=Mycobacteroides abscessus TaxID=36809 RepID=UPI0009260F5A|nr:hypothetical protein [Mycobacteroides abscessus]SIG31374.1 Uncharacterised protein [Mycobacteroides abscessus subsp. abscessus]SIH57323.1 Uncharacterised protein [Mycobacteroides abscessus subsp. abscessus]SIM81569.1 Uncharacterised protein [Mycobacteroides abscessus subsp. abscessus]